MRAATITMALLAATIAHADSEQAQIDFANGLFARGFFGEALGEYKNYLAQWPDGAHAQDARYRLGESAFASGDYEAAVAAYDGLMAGAVEDSIRQHASLSRAEALYRLARLEEAGVAFGPLAAEGSDPAVRARALYYLLKVRRDQGDMKAASTVFDTFAATFPDDPLFPYAQYHMAFIHMGLGDPEKAAIAFSAVAAAEVEPELRAESRYRAAEIYEEAGWFDAAVEAYETLRREHPESTYAERAETGQIWAYYNAGKYAETKAAAEQYIAANEAGELLPGVHYLLGNSLQELGEHEAALAQYRKLRDTWPDSSYAGRAQYKMAWTHFLQDDRAAAKAEAEAYLAANTEAADASSAAYLLATVLMEEGNCEAAQPRFAEVAASESSEFAAEALFRSAECLEQLGLVDGAAGAYQDFAQRYPEHALALQARLRAADSAFRAQQYENAMAQYAALLEASLEASIEEEIRYRHALTAHNIADFETSTREFLALVEKFPESAHAAEAWFRIGESRLRDENNIEDAIAAYEKSLQLSGDGEYAGRALKGMALARYEGKDLDRAAEQFLQLLQEYPEIELNEETFSWTAQHFFDQGRWEEAVRAFEVVLEERSDAPEAAAIRLLLGRCYEELSRPDDARAQYLAILESAPSSSAALEAGFRLAGLHEAAGEIEDAISRYEAAANANAGDLAARARFRLGALHEAQGDCEKASREYMRIAILFLHEELSPEALLRAARCFEKTDRAAQAVTAYQELVADFPESKQADAAREALAALGN